MVTTRSIPEGVQAVFPMLVCQSPEAEMNFCAVAFGAVEQVRRPGPDGSPIHRAMRINGAFLVVQSAFPDAVASGAPFMGTARRNTTACSTMRETSSVTSMVARWCI